MSKVRLWAWVDERDDKEQSASQSSLLAVLQAILL